MELYRASLLSITKRGCQNEAHLALFSFLISFLSFSFSYLFIPSASEMPLTTPIRTANGLSRTHADTMVQA
jgi:hypothetical protein